MLKTKSGNTNLPHKNMTAGKKTQTECNTKSGYAEKQERSEFDPKSYVRKIQ